MLALAFVSPSGEFQREGHLAIRARWCLLTRWTVVELAAGTAGEDVCWVADVLGEEIVGEEVNRLGTLLAGKRLDPEEIFDMGLIGAALETPSAVEGTDLFIEGAA